MKLVEPIFTEQAKSNVFILSDEVTDDELQETKNYCPSEHNLIQWLSYIDENGYFAVTKQENQCMQSVQMTSKLVYMTWDILSLTIWFLTLIFYEFVTEF